MSGYSLQTYDVDLEGGSFAIPCAGYAYASVQVLPVTYSTTTGVLEVKRGVCSNQERAESYSTAVTPNMTTKAISAGIELKDDSYIFIDNTTADSGESCQVVVYMTEGDASESDGATARLSEWIEYDGRAVAFGCGSYGYASAAILPEYGSTSGVVEIKRGLTPNEADAESFDTAVLPNMTTSAAEREIDCKGYAYLIAANTTADSGKRARVVLQLTDAQRPAQGGGGTEVHATYAKDGGGAAIGTGDPRSAPMIYAGQITGLAFSLETSDTGTATVRVVNDAGTDTSVGTASITTDDTPGGLTITWSTGSGSFAVGDRIEIEPTTGFSTATWAMIRVYGTRS
jgi:hypothetical protein